MKTIAWDVDDVLNDLMRCWFETHWLPAHATCALRYQDIVRNPPHQLLGIGEDEYWQSLDEFRVSSKAQAMHPVPAVLEWFHLNGEKFRHIALTQRPASCVPEASRWVFHHFGRWIRSFNFVPAHRKNPAMPEYDHTKNDFLLWLGKADIIVDDNVSTINAASSLGIKGIIMPRPWNGMRAGIPETLGIVQQQ